MKTLLVLFASLVGFASYSQQKATNDSAAMAQQKASTDSFFAALFAKAIYPVITTSKMSGVIPVDYATEKSDHKQHYKIAMEITDGYKDTAKTGEVNSSLAEVGRLYNIHIAEGIPKENLDVVVVAHGPVLESFYNNAAYQKKYHKDNPNVATINELAAAGVKFIGCGQAMAFFNYDKNDMLPLLKYALSAQTVLTDRQVKGYYCKKIVPED